MCVSVKLSPDMTDLTEHCSGAVYTSTHSVQFNQTGSTTLCTHIIIPHTRFIALLLAARQQQTGLILLPQRTLLDNLDSSSEYRASFGKFKLSECETKRWALLISSSRSKT
jgi:hypothetical protein